ncbi:MAG: sulfite exporter TauE/SafE family protein [Methanobacteriota archaeon]
MSPLEELLLVVVASVLAGLAGSYLGVGGGIFLVPFLTLGIRVDLPVAVATSLIGVIATSSGAASVYVRDRLVNLRLGMFLEIATTLGAVVGASLAVLVDARYLFLLFAAVVLYTAVYMAITRESAKDRVYRPGRDSTFAARLDLSSIYFDHEDQGVYRYRVGRPGAGFAVGGLAGALSGLLGIGGGFVKVPAMNVLMGVPMKPAVATSNFMIGVTAAASAFIYYARGLVNPSLAAMVIVGVFTGTRVGARLLLRGRAQRVRFVFAVLLAAIAGLMGLRAFDVAVVP